MLIAPDGRGRSSRSGQRIVLGCCAQAVVAVMSSAAANERRREGVRMGLSFG
jgi:hypothetical protein